MNRIKTYICLSASVYLMLFFCQYAYSQSKTETAGKRINKELKKTWRKARIAGGLLAVVDDQKLIWSQTYGYANAKTRQPITGDTLFPSGELTKLITGIAAMQLVEQGLLDLDQSIDHYLPELDLLSRDPNWPVPSVRQLMSHHAGLPITTLAGSFQEQPTHALASLQQVFIAQKPGQIYTYSDLGFSVLAHIIQTIRDKPYQQVIRENILNPLGMMQSGFKSSSDVAIGHSQKGRLQTALYPRDLGALGLYVTMNDLVKLVRWLFKEDTSVVLDRRWLEEMQQVQNASTPLDLDNRAGLVWQLTNVDQHGVDHVLRINSANLQFRIYLLLAPKQRLGVIVFSNSDQSSEEVFGLGQFALDQMLEAKYGIPVPELEKKLNKPIALPRLSTPDRLRNSYVTALGAIAFSGDQEKSNVRFIGRGFRAKKREDGWYQISYRLLGLIDLRFSFLKDILLRPAQIEGFNTLLAYYQGSVFLLGTELQLNQTQSFDYRPYLGRYRLTNPDQLTKQLKLKEIELYEDQGHLFVTYRLPVFFSLKPEIPLSQLSGSTFFLPGLGTNLGDR